MAAIDRLQRSMARCAGLSPRLAPRLVRLARAAGGLMRRIGPFFPGVLAATSAKAVDLPEDRADLMYHEYTGGGVTALGPAVLVRKNILDRFSLTGSYYVDMVSNASIDVVTQASKYKETRQEFGAGLDYAYRDTSISLTGSNSSEPDYTASSYGVDVSHETFGGMTTVSLGYTHGWDWVGKHNSPNFSASASHWQYRLGLTQVLTPRWLASVNLEAIGDQGFLGSPYRAVRVFGAFVPERDPATRSSRAATLRVSGDIGSGSALRLQYRYFWDTWDIRAHTAEVAYSRHFGSRWLADASFRYYRQSKALFYSDNFTQELTYMSRNRQLSTFDSLGPGVKVAYTVAGLPSRYQVRLNGAYQWLDFRYSDFTDVRTGQLYSFNASVMEFFVSANF